MTGNEGTGRSLGGCDLGRVVVIGGTVVVGVVASAAASPNFLVAAIATLDPDSRLSLGGGGVLVLPRGESVLAPADAADRGGCDPRLDTGGAEAVVLGVFGGSGWLCCDIE